MLTTDNQSWVRVYLFKNSTMAYKHLSGMSGMSINGHERYDTRKYIQLMFVTMAIQ